MYTPARMPGPDTLASLIDRGAFLSELAALADGLGDEERVRVVRALSGRQIKRLYARAEGNAEAVSVDFLVPPSTPKGHSVDWPGMNSLPAFRKFSKRFTRSAQPGTLVGQNTGAWSWFAGPGYFLASARPGRPSELLLDYTRYPEAAPPGWPTLRRNSFGGAIFVFYNMHDYVRPVGRHLAVGAAFNPKGKFKGQYFAIARGATLPIGN